jgi:hypothetical protein
MNARKIKMANSTFFVYTSENGRDWAVWGVEMASTAKSAAEGVATELRNRRNHSGTPGYGVKPTHKVAAVFPAEECNLSDRLNLIANKGVIVEVG